MKSRRWLSVQGAAALLNTTEGALRRMLFTGRIPYFKLGPRRVRIRIEDIEAALIRQATDPTAEDDHETSDEG